MLVWHLQLLCKLGCLGHNGEALQHGSDWCNSPAEHQMHTTTLHRPRNGFKTKTVCLSSSFHCCFSIYDYVCQLRAAYLSNTKCPFLAYSHNSMHAIGVQQRASCSAAWQFWRGGFRDTAALAHAAGPQSVLHPVATSSLPVVLPTHCCNAVSLAPGLRCC